MLPLLGLGFIGVIVYLALSSGGGTSTSGGVTKFDRASAQQIFNDLCTRRATPLAGSFDAVEASPGAVDPKLSAAAWTSTSAAAALAMGYRPVLASAYYLSDSVKPKYLRIVDPGKQAEYSKAGYAVLAETYAELRALIDASPLNRIVSGPVTPVGPVGPPVKTAPPSGGGGGGFPGIADLTKKIGELSTLDPFGLGHGGAPDPKDLGGLLDMGKTLGGGNLDDLLKKGKSILDGKMPADPFKTGKDILDGKTGVPGVPAGVMPTFGAPRTYRAAEKRPADAGAKEIQNELVAEGYSVGAKGADGFYWGDTEAAVKKFQAAHMLTVDGVFGPNTRTAMQAAWALRNGVPFTAPPPSGGVPSMPNPYSAHLKDAQERLVESGYTDAPSPGTGYYDAGTTKAFKSYQADNSIPVTGVLDVTTDLTLFGEDSPYYKGATGKTDLTTLDPSKLPMTYGGGI